MPSSVEFRNKTVKSLALLIMMVVLVEGGIFLFLSLIPVPVPLFVKTIIDVTLLVTVLCPLFYKQLLVPLLQEIENRRTAEDSLRSSELRYRLVTDNLVDVIFALDTNLEFTFLTPSIKNLAGYQITEVISTNIQRYLDIASSEKYNLLIAEALNEQGEKLQSNVIRNGEFRLICSNGSTKWVEIDSTFIFNKGALEQIVGVICDIDAKKIAATELIDAYKLLDKTLSSLNEAVFIVSPQDGIIIRVNNTAEKMFGYSAAELVGSNTSILHLNDAMYNSYCEKITSSCAENGFLETTFRLKRKDGSIFDSEHLVTPITIESSNCVNHIHVIRDISTRVSIEEDLAILVQEVETRNRFVESVFTNLQSGIIVVDLDLRIKMVNNYAAEFCQLTAAQLVTRKLADISPQLNERVLEGRSTDELLVDFLDVQKVIGYSLFTLPNASGEAIGHILNFKDLTEIVRIRQELRQKERLSAMGEVVARVAHEMRNPLFGMTAAAQILEMELSLEPNQKELMDSLLKESRRLNNLVEELLDTTRETRISKKRVDLINVIDESLRAIEALLNEKQIFLHKSYTGKIWVSADFEKLEQVIINLVKNAMEASRTEGRIAIDISMVDNGVIMTVTDNGEGIPAENLERIFDVFYTTKKNGTGMGLSICRSIVEAHGGSLFAQNNPDGGAQFIMQLPLGERPA